MRIVQSFWSGKKNDALNESYGWYSPQHHLMGWALSCLKLRSFYDDVILYTDEIGYNLLIKELKLPYTKVHVELDYLDKYKLDLWSLSKVYTYSKQTEPFLHVDGDVFIWDEFKSNLLDKPLIAQNLEIEPTHVLESMLNEMEQKLVFVPEEFFDIFKKEKKFPDFNAGILGGYDIEFFKEYTERAFEIVDKNKDLIYSLSDSTLFCILIEQYLFYCISKTKQKKVSTLIPNFIQDIGYKGFGDFQRVPYEKTYLHLLGPHKRDFLTCELLRRKLLEEYPDFYYRVISLYPSLYQETKKILRNKIDTFDKHSLHKGVKPLEIKDCFHRLIYCLVGSNFFGNKENTEFEFNNFDSIEKYAQIKNNTMLSDLFNLEKTIWNFVITNLELSKESLYLSDINSNKYYKKLFERKSNWKHIQIRKKSSIQIVETSWNWHVENRNLTPFLGKVEANIKIKKNNHKTILIPEIDWPFYSEFLIDEFDNLLIGLISQPISISALYNKLETYIEVGNDTKATNKDLELLYEGRLERLITYKCIELH